MRIRSVTLAFLLVATGCASSGDAPVSSAREVRVPVDLDLGSSVHHVTLVRDDRAVSGRIEADIADAWRNLLAVYADLGFDVKELTEYLPEARRITVNKRRVRRIADERLSRFIDCGYSIAADKADAGQVQVLLSTWLEPAEGGTTVSTRLEAWSRDSGTSTQAVSCASRGRLEQVIADQLLLRTIQEKQGG